MNVWEEMMKLAPWTEEGSISCWRISCCSTTRRGTRKGPINEHASSCSGPGFGHSAWGGVSIMGVYERQGFDSASHRHVRNSWSCYVYEVMMEKYIDADFPRSKYEDDDAIAA